jgi:histone H1/5
MADTAVATAPAKLPKKKTAAKPKKPSTHPKYSEMEVTAISALKERGGSSRQAILKYIMANFNVGKDAKPVNAHLKLALRTGVKNKSLKQLKGTGASGSFKIGEVKAAKKPAKVKKAAKPKAAKPKKAKKPAAKKAAGKKRATKPKIKKAKKPSTKKASAKPKKVKSSKKTSAKPKAKKAPKKK